MAATARPNANAIPRNQIPDVPVSEIPETVAAAQPISTNAKVPRPSEKYFFEDFILLI